jgi:hypothetical protein
MWNQRGRSCKITDVITGRCAIVVICAMLLAGCTSARTVRPASVGAQASTPTHSIPMFVSESGRFSIQYPADYTLHTDERPGVDGVISSLPENTIAILSNTSPNFLLTIQYISPVNDPSPGSLTGSVSYDLDLSAGQTILIENQPALRFPRN